MRQHPPTSVTGWPQPLVERVELAPAVSDDAAVRPGSTPTMFDEAFRTLRSNLMLHAARGMQTFLVVSARPREGKSTVTAKLACSLADAQKRVLLIDADLRRPTAHRLFRIANSYGLADVLQGAREVEDTWRTTHQGPVVLTSGPRPADPQALLESDRLVQLLSVARCQFDVVVIDSAPLLAVADTTLIAPRADAVILVLKYARVSEAEATLTMERLRAAQGKVIGCVLSHVSALDDTYCTYASDYMASR